MKSIPCKKICILKEYTRYRYKLVSFHSSKKNRHQNTLTVCNIALDSVVSDIFGKSSTSIIDYLLITKKSYRNFLGSSNPKKKTFMLLGCLTSSSNESAGKKKSVRITGAGVYLEPALVRCDHVAAKSDKSSHYKKKYKSIAKRHGKKRDIIAIARMILTLLPFIRYCLLMNSGILAIFIKSICL